MGSGTNRAWRQEQGTRTGRRDGAKAGSARRKKTATYLRAQARKAAARRRASEGR
jgi:hypothetical protein